MGDNWKLWSGLVAVCGGGVWRMLKRQTRSTILLCPTQPIHLDTCYKWQERIELRTPKKHWYHGAGDFLLKDCRIMPLNPAAATRSACNINISKPPWFLLSFYPTGAIDTLSITDEKYFKPSRQDFRPPPPEDDTAKTKHGWHFKSGSYLLLPFREAFGKQFPSQYTVMLTIRPSKDLGDVSENELMHTMHISQLAMLLQIKLICY